MTEGKTTDQVVAVRLLSLLLAGLLWLGVNLERPGEVKLQVPVVLGHLPAGLMISSAAPGSVEVTVSGPRVLLLGPWLRDNSCHLDLSAAQPGAASYSTAECNLGLDRELKVVRVHPALVHLDFAKAAPASR
jgi:YbbR domain-containing protein